MENPGKSAQQRGYAFEREVAAIYRALGVRVQHNVVLAGSQIDILLEEQTSSGSLIKSAVECKAYTRPVGVDVVMQVASLTALLKQRGIIDCSILVSLSGFTTGARGAAESMGIELIELSDLQQRAAGKTEAVEAAEKEIDYEFEKAQRESASPKRLFVVMPFAAEFEDVYILGIRDVAEKMALAVARADDIEHNENILEVIQEQIRDCDIVVADITAKNPNVLYEVGYAHSAGRPTVLLCRQGEKVPFDLQALNYVTYSSIVELREKLELRLRKMLDR